MMMNEKSIIKTQIYKNNFNFYEKCVFRCGIKNFITFITASSEFSIL